MILVMRLLSVVWCFWRWVLPVGTKIMCPSLSLILIVFIQLSQGAVDEGAVSQVFGRLDGSQV